MPSCKACKANLLFLSQVGRGGTAEVSEADMTEDTKNYLGLTNNVRRFVAFERIDDGIDLRSHPALSDRLSRHQSLLRELRVLTHQQIRDHPNIVRLADLDL